MTLSCDRILLYFFIWRAMAAACRGPDFCFVPSFEAWPAVLPSIALSCMAPCRQCDQGQDDALHANHCYTLFRFPSTDLMLTDFFLTQTSTLCVCDYPPIQSPQLLHALYNTRIH